MDATRRIFIGVLQRYQCASRAWGSPRFFSGGRLQQVGFLTLAETGAPFTHDTLGLMRLWPPTTASGAEPPYVLYPCRRSFTSTLRPCVTPQLLHEAQTCDSSRREAVAHLLHEWDSAASTTSANNAGAGQGQIQQAHAQAQANELLRLCARQQAVDDAIKVRAEDVRGLEDSRTACDVRWHVH